MKTKYLRSILILSVAFLSSGCSTILSGRSQTITISTNPSGALCQLTREGRNIGQVSPTPGGVMVERSKHDLSVICSKEGYQDATEYIESGTESATFGNILAGGLIGWGVDSATGADNRYPEVKSITLVPLQTAQSAMLRSSLQLGR